MLQSSRQETERRRSHPFDDAEAAYLVLVNEEGQHSLWPSTLDVPAGWRVALAEASRDACLAFVEENWTDLRPRSLRAATAPGS
ncbi:MbtH family protein [Streptomyces sp. TRM70308]|uniref:MbtH family protein n=1 Tax=Streptomyces TaxID=1883 RepID=UPI002249996F|nr:MbtH family protein [Streptomyces sp. JHD 1]MCX2969330.1 MbtH family protein [Streptomyces sp. JHD 1]